MLVEKLYCC